MIIKQSIIDKI